MVLTQLNSMFRNGNNQIFEIEAKINDIFYNKINSGAVSFSNHNDNFMKSNFGFEYHNGDSYGNAKHENNLEAHASYINTKIQSLNIHLEDLEEYYSQNKEDLRSENVKQST